MKLYCLINGNRYEIGEGSTFSEEYNETLDSGSIILDHLSSKINDLTPYNDVFIYDDLTVGETEHNFEKHMLIDSFSEESNNVRDLNYITYKYKINLFSETKRLDKISLPNISITQPLDKQKRRTVYEYLTIFLNLYSPKIKIIDNEQNHTWKYENKYRLSNNVQNLFSKVNAPEMSLSQPTLKDLISKLMITKDCIPVVHNDEIDYLDITLRNGEFKVNNNVNFIHGSMSSGNYSLEARREYSGAISQDSTAKMIEFLGFRNSSSALMTIENLRIETRFPIYKINKLYLCYYKKAKILNSDLYNVFLVKQDITDLVLQNIVRNAMKLDPTGFDPSSILDTKNLSNWKIATIGYDIGSNLITGWGEKYSFYNTDLSWFKKEYTTLENIISFVDLRTPFGIKGSFIARENSMEFIEDTNLRDGISSIFTDGVFNNSNVIKSVFFELDYNAMFNGAVIHSKDFVNNDDINTTDNCSSSLSILESDGLFEKEKMNRFANKTYSIQSRYEGKNAYNDMNNPTLNNHILGSVYDNDIIIYHKEFSIFENFVLANFSGTHDYVLKNYYTTVFAKLRTYNLASYSESVLRSENYKEYLLLSDKECYYDSITFSNNFIDKICSCFNVTTIPETTFNFSYNNKINFAFIQTKFANDSETWTQDQINSSRSFADVNCFVCGVSLCVNTEMFDNATQGVYINKPNSDNGRTGTDQVVGCQQEWKIAVNDISDPFQQKISFGFGHIYTYGDIIPPGKNSIIDEKAKKLEEISVQNIFNYKILKMPTFGKDIQQYYLDNCAGFYFVNENNILYKDNKEKINFTFQIDPISNSENICFSSWFMKLCDLSGNFLKFDTFDYKENSFTKDLEVLTNLQFGFTTSSGIIKPMLTIKVPKNYNFPLSPYTTNISGSYAKHLYSSLPNNMTVALKLWKISYSYGHLVSYTSIYNYAEEEPAEPEYYQNMVKITNVNDFYDSQYSGIIDFENYDYYQPQDKDAYGIPFSTGINTSVYGRKEETRKLSSTVPSVLNDPRSMNVLKNILVVASTDKINKEIIYNEYDTITRYLTVISTKKGITTVYNHPNNWYVLNKHENEQINIDGIDIPFNNLFNFSLNPNTGKPEINVGNVNIPTILPLSIEGSKELKSIQFWFIDTAINDFDSTQKYGSLKFVFGVNLDNGCNTKKVYVSSLKKRSTKVYSADHKSVVGHIKNMAEDSTYTAENKYVEV